MKNKILYLLVLLLLLSNFNTVSANVVGDDNYTGSGQDNNAEAESGLGKGKGPCPNGLCLYNNANEAAVQVSISYIDNNGRTDYHTEVWTNNPNANGQKTSTGQVMIYKDFLPKGGNYVDMANAIDNYFLSNNGAGANEWYNKYADTTLATQDSNALNPAEYGARIISTPVLRFNDHGNTNYLSVKEIAKRYNELTNKGRFDEIAKLFTTEYTDVGIMMPDGTINPLFVASLFNGYGYNIIDFMKLLGIKSPLNKKPQPSCPGGSMNTSNPSADCTEVLGGNTFTYSYTASGGGQANVHRQYGIDQNASGTGAYCKLFCQEYGTAVLPGALVTSIQLGSYSIWPTSTSNETNRFLSDNYPLKFSGRKECKLVLMPDHNNFPGNGCLQDPVAEYMCLYNGTKVAGSKYVCGKTYASSIMGVGNTTDYAGVKYENVRIGNGAYFNKPDYCGKPKETLKTIKCSNNAPMCKSAYTIYKVEKLNKYYNSDNNINGRANYTYYKQLIDKIENAAYNAKNACEKVTQSTINLANSNKTCPYCPTQVQNGMCIGGYKWSTCQDVLDARAAVNACASANNAYDAAVNATKSIEDSIEKCKSYITDFNWAREILNEIGLCGNFSASGSDYYNFSSMSSISYENGEYEVKGSLDKEVDSSISCEGQCGGLGFKIKTDYRQLFELDTPAILSGKVSQIENRTINFVASETVYALNSDYSYIDKEKNKYSKKPLGSNYLAIKSLDGGLAKVLPTDYSLDIVNSKNEAIKYEMSLTNTSFGENNKFNVTNNGDYVCEFEVSKKTDSCICPQDSKMPGKDLMYYVANDPISCADAQIKYCDSGDSPEYNDLYCPDMVTPLTSCLKTGIGYDACVKLVCNGDGEYKCKNTNGLRTGMDITDCVQTKRAQGLTLQQALDYCDSVVCPIGKTIIYRTIRLENPFPSIDADSTVSQTGLKIGMFNNDIKGRYPGTNWNGVLTVKNKIRNNRSADGTSIYQTKQPLYTFVLNGVTIKNIRDYNDKQKEGYNDFTLECKKDKHAGCISYVFVHNSSLSGLTGGTCRNISLNSGFYTCDD